MYLIFKVTRISLFVFIFSALHVSFADSFANSNKDKILKNWRFLPSSGFLVSAPPRQGDHEYKQDYEKLFDYQKNRSDEECKEATLQDRVEYFQLFGSVTPRLKRWNDGFVALFIDQIFILSGRISEKIKNKYKRLRPYENDSNITPCAPKPGGYSYPSGHATVGSVGACILKEIFPEHKEKILEQGKYVGILRVIAGVHHPSDVQAGYNLGLDICRSILQNKSFRKELDVIRMIAKRDE